MTDIVKKELEQNIQALKHCVDKIVFYADTTEEIVKLNFESIRMMVDYCEQLSLTEWKRFQLTPIPYRFRLMQRFTVLRTNIS